MKNFLSIGMIASAAFSAVIALSPNPAHAIVLTLSNHLRARNGSDDQRWVTQQFALVITGENSITDPFGGRTGINRSRSTIWARRYRV